MSVYDSVLLLVICFSSLIAAADYYTKEEIKVSRSFLIVSVSFLMFEFRLRDEEMRGTAGRTFAVLLQEDPGIWTLAVF